MNGFMSADFCCVPMWTPLVRYTSSGTRSPSTPICSSSCILFLGEPFLDPDELVELRGSLPADRTGLDREGTEGDREVRDRLVRRLPAPVGHNGRIPIPMCEVNRRFRVGYRANLVRLNKDAVRGVHFDALPEAAHIRREQVVPDHEAFLANDRRELCIAGEVVLVERVLDGEQTVAFNEAGDELDLVLRREGSRSVVVHPIAVEFRRREVERGADLESDLRRDRATCIREEAQRGFVLQRGDPRAFIPASERARRDTSPEKVARDAMNTCVRKHGRGRGRPAGDAEELLD